MPKDGFKIIVSVKLTNSIYQANVENKELTFQHVIYNLRFMSEGLQSGQGIDEILIPQLKVINEDGIILRGENA
jgi:hypothetical protein